MFRHSLLIVLLTIFGLSAFNLHAQQLDSIDGMGHRLDQAYANRNWKEAARLEQKFFLLENNPSRLYTSARVYAWMRDTAMALHMLDTAVKYGYTNIYVIDADTSFTFLRGTSAWQASRRLAGENYSMKEEVFYWGFYYGVLVLILVFNLFLFFSNKETSYLFLCFIILADIHFEILSNSSLKIYIARLLPWIAWSVVHKIPSNSVFVGVLLVSYLLFTQSFLKLKQTLPKFNRMVNVLLAIVTITVICVNWGIVPDLLGRLVVGTTFIVALIAGIKQWRNKHTEAGYFVVAVMVITIGMFINGMIDIFIYSTLNVGILLFFTILTLGVGRKVRVMQKEKAETQERMLEELEIKVEERTKEVTSQKRIIEEKQHEIVDSIKYAQRLQHAILPPMELIKEIIPESFVLYQPKDIVAGDFYWAEQINDLFFIAAADSTGHGVPGALVSVVCSNALDRSVKEFGLTEPGKILDKARELVVETFQKSSADVKDGMDISLLCIDKKNRKISWSGANNPLWYVEGGLLKELKANKQPIGKVDSPVRFVTREVPWNEQTAFYLFTDGYADQFGGPKGKKFKYKQLAELLVSINEKPMTEQCEVIGRQFESWKGVLEQVDDVCIVAFKLKGFEQQGNSAATATGNSLS